MILDEARGEKVGRDEEDGHAGVLHRSFDLVEPFLPGSNAAVVPGLEAAIPRRAGQMGDEPVFPGFVLVAVADEDGGGHGGDFSGFWVVPPSRAERAATESSGITDQPRRGDLR